MWISLIPHNIGVVLNMSIIAIALCILLLNMADGPERYKPARYPSVPVRVLAVIQMGGKGEIGSICKFGHSK
ncbi:MAG: hypothetical protein KJO66_07645 [Gammaproteobacteria bacterium]|nr:hypothetical protein [Gammaproteobacteria bacterium]